jgi:hypothetical protein
MRRWRKFQPARCLAAFAPVARAYDAGLNVRIPRVTKFHKAIFCSFYNH